MGDPGTGGIGSAPGTVSGMPRFWLWMQVLVVVFVVAFETEIVPPSPLPMRMPRAPLMVFVPLRL